MLTTQEVLDGWEKCAFSEVFEERNHDLCAALEQIRASVDATEASLRLVLDAVRAYLPPDGITKDELISRVIALVDPWPTGTPTLQSSYSYARRF